MAARNSAELNRHHSQAMGEFSAEEAMSSFYTQMEINRIINVTKEKLQESPPFPAA
jgi:hypothetical protein